MPRTKSRKKSVHSSRNPEKPASRKRRFLQENFVKYMRVKSLDVRPEYKKCNDPLFANPIGMEVVVIEVTDSSVLVEDAKGQRRRISAFEFVGCFE